MARETSPATQRTCCASSHLNEESGFHTKGEVTAAHRQQRPCLKFLAVLVSASFGVVGPAWSETVHGAHLPDGAQKVGENRYRVSQDFETTLKHYKAVYSPANYPRTMIVNQPGIKAVHIANPSGKNFEGLNIYQANDEVRIYIVPAAEPKPKKKK